MTSMRKILPLLLLAAAPFAASAPINLGARSAQHELRLQRSAIAPDRIAYDVVVTDLANNATVLNKHTEGKPGEALEVMSVSGAQKIHVRLSYSVNFFSATVIVVEGEAVVDEFRTWWQLEPRKPDVAVVPLAVPPGGYDAAGPLRVGGDVKAPIVINRVEPAYTAEARANHISGIVIVEAVVGKDGFVKNVLILKPLPFGLDQAAVDAVRLWQVRPGTLNGVPVDVIFNLTVNFKLDTAPQQP